MITSRRYLCGKLLFLLLLCLVGLNTTIAQEFEDDSPPSYRKYYKNEWSVRIDSNDDGEADLLAAKYGFINKGRVSGEHQISCFKDCYVQVLVFRSFLMIITFYLSATVFIRSLHVKQEDRSTESFLLMDMC